MAYQKGTDKVDMALDAPRGKSDAAAVRKMIEEAARKIPDSALQGLKSFRLIVRD